MFFGMKNPQICVFGKFLGSFWEIFGKFLGKSETLQFQEVEDEKKGF